MISFPIYIKKHSLFFTEENKELETFKAEKNGSDVCLLEPWEVGYWAEKLKKERYDFDDEDLRPYFPIQSVLDGMFNLVARVFGLKIVERSTVFEGKTSQQIHSSEQPVEVWHPDVRFYDLFDSASNKLLGSFYADWHPRSSKRAGAWMNHLKTGEPDEKGYRPPHPWSNLWQSNRSNIHQTGITDALRSGNYFFMSSGIFYTIFVEKYHTEVLMV